MSTRTCPQCSPAPTKSADTTARWLDRAKLQCDCWPPPHTPDFGSRLLEVFLLGTHAHSTECGEDGSYLGSGAHMIKMSALCEMRRGDEGCG